jgi:hypothetical protein
LSASRAGSLSLGSLVRFVVIRSGVSIAVMPAAAFEDGGGVLRTTAVVSVASYVGIELLCEHVGIFQLPALGGTSHRAAMLIVRSDSIRESILEKTNGDYWRTA